MHYLNTPLAKKRQNYSREPWPKNYKNSLSKNSWHNNKYSLFLAFSTRQWGPVALASAYLNVHGTSLRIKYLSIHFNNLMEIVHNLN